MKKKKLTAILLAVMMVFCYMPSMAFADGGGETQDGTGTDDSAVAEVISGDTTTAYNTLADAFSNVKTGDTVKLLNDVTITEQINIKKALNGLTFDGNGKTVTLKTTTDPNQSGGSGFYFGNPNESLWCTGIKIKDLTIEGTARFAIFLSGGTVSEFDNVNISGNYLYAVNLYGTHGGTFTNCNISNSLDLGDNNESGAAVWSNVAADNPVKLINSDLGIIGINKYTTANKLAPKIFVDENSKATIHTWDDCAVSDSPWLCVSTTSAGIVDLMTKNADTGKWESQAVVKNGEKYYGDIQTAIDNVKSGDTITLLNDITMDKTYFGAKAGETLTLDLNGYTLTRTWQDWGPGEDTTTKSVVYNQGTLTIKDSSDAKTGKIQGHSDTSGKTGWNQEFKGAAISNATGAVLNVEGGTITRGDENSFGYYTVYNKGTINMSGGLITNGSIGSAMVCNVAGGSTFVMTGGELRQEGFQTLKNESGSIIKINGGKLTSGDRTIQNYGTATLNGGIFEGDIQILASGALTITGGMYKGELYGNSEGIGTVMISGGIFTTAPDEKYIVDGKRAYKNGDEYNVWPIQKPNTGTSGTTTPPAEDNTPADPVVTPSVSITNGEAKAAVTNNQANEIIKAAEASNGATVEIKAETKADVKAASVEMPANILTEVAEKTESDLAVKTAAGDVEITNEGLNEMAKTIGTGNKVEVKVEDVDAVMPEAEGALQAVSVTITVDGNKVTENFGELTISVPVAEKNKDKVKAGDEVYVLHYKSDGTVEKIKAVVVDGKLVFKTRSLSRFVVLETGDGFGETVDFGVCMSSLQSVSLNGETVSCEVYNIDGYNYFKLRDIAEILKGLEAEFGVAAGADDYKITVDTAALYESVGGELDKSTDKSSTCVKSLWTLTVDDYTYDMWCYNIGGNNYFQLRALGVALGFNVAYDAATNTAVITAK